MIENIFVNQLKTNMKKKIKKSVNHLQYMLCNAQLMFVEKFFSYPQHFRTKQSTLNLNHTR